MMPLAQRLAALCFLLVGCVCTAVSQRVNDSLPIQLAKPLQYVAADSIIFFDLYWSRVLDSARSVLSVGASRPPHISKYKEKAWAAAVTAWQQRTADSLNLLGGVGSMEHSSQAEAALQTVQMGLPLFMQSAQGQIFEAIEYALYNSLRAALSPKETVGMRRAAAQTFLDACHYMAATDDEGIYVNLYAASKIKAQVGKRPVVIEVDTSYPWFGFIRLRIDVLHPDKRMKVRVRLPLWAQGKTLMPHRLRVEKAHNRARVSVGSEQMMKHVINNYVVLDGEWNGEESVIIELGMPVQHFTDMTAAPLQRQNADPFLPQLIRRGPFTYGFILPTLPFYYNNQAVIRWLFDTERRRAYILYGNLHATPPPYEAGKAGEVPFQMAPYYVLYDEQGSDVQIWTRQPH